MIPASDPLLPFLQKLVAEEKWFARLSPIAARVADELAARPDEPMTWEPLDSRFFDNELPSQIASSWIFAIRAGTYLGVERHPNSYQRTIALRGSGLFELYDNGVWQPSPIASLAEARSVSIPQNTWHRVTIGPEDLTVISFHTAPAKELIEEKPLDETDLTQTHSRTYSAE